MKYFFRKWGDFTSAVKNKNILLLLDFDGTLAPIVPRPGDARIPQPVRECVKDLSRNRRITVGIVSGRRLSDLRQLAGIKGIFYAGDHGLVIKGPREVFVHPAYKKCRPYLKKIADTLRRDTAGIKGAIVERKKMTISVHYRLVAAKDISRLRSIFKKVTRPYVKGKKVRMETGKKILDIKPPVIWNKGKAVEKIEKMSGKKNNIKVFIGDDLTDEDAFGVLGKRDFSIRVGRKKSSKARYFLKNPAEVRRLLVKIREITALFFIVISLSVASMFSQSFAEEVAQETTAEEAPEKAATEEAPRKIPIIGNLMDILSDEPDDLDTDNYSTRTKDGWEISIKRYIAEEGKPKAAVILCHGFNINNKFWDLDKRSSPARFLAKAGYDVWAPSLRGSGLSSKPVLSRVRSIVKFELRELPQMLFKAPFDITKFGWTIDDHIHKDIPAIIDLVRKKSGFDKVYWIGHSMGGIVMFGYLETETQRHIAGFIPISSMMVIHKPLNEYQERIANQKPLLTASLIVNTTVASQLSNYTFGTVKSPIEELLLERENMHKDVVFKFFRTCIDDTAAGVVGQFSDSMRMGEIVSSDRKYSYTDNLHRVRVPLLFLSGRADGFVSERMMRDAYDWVSSKDKSIVIVSKANGYTTDYGHCDLILGKNSKAEVYPVILQWLDERTAGRR